MVELSRYWPPGLLHTLGAAGQIYQREFLCGFKFFALNIFCEEYLQPSLCLMLQLHVLKQFPIVDDHDIVARAHAVDWEPRPFTGSRLSCVAQVGKHPAHRMLQDQRGGEYDTKGEHITWLYTINSWYLEDIAPKTLKKRSLYKRLKSIVWLLSIFLVAQWFWKIANSISVIWQTIFPKPSQNISKYVALSEDQQRARNLFN